MIEGIEILLQEVCNELQTVPLFLCIIILSLIGMLIDLFNDFSDGIIGAFVGCILGLCIYAIIFNVILPEKYVKYKVTISEDVSMTEFNDRYEIIDVDGKIYTIKERDYENK